MDDSNSFLSPYKILPMSQENKHLGIFMDFFLFYHEIIYYVYSLESPHRAESNKYIQYTIIVEGVKVKQPGDCITYIEVNAPGGFNTGNTFRKSCRSNKQTSAIARVRL